MMKAMPWRVGLLACVIPAALFVVGCSRETPKVGHGAGATTQVAQSKGHDHSGWWCEEHGVPEAECSMCSAKVAAEFKNKGDWCELHDRAKSQCFICDPTLEARFAARYEAKYGK